MKMKFTMLLAICMISCAKEQSSHLANKPINLPELFLPGIVTDTTQLDFGMTISPDSKTVLFTRRIDDGKQKIYETHYKNGQWTTPSICSFSTDRDENPHFTPDGKTVYFGSERPIPGRPNKGGFDMNVWKTSLIDNEWTEPIPLPKNINAVQVEGEEWPSSNLSHFVTADGKTFYTGTLVRGDKGLDIYESTFDGNTYSDFKKLPHTVNLEDKWEYAPIISPDGQYLFTQVYARKDGIGGDDIYVSKKDAKGNWLPSKNLGMLINTNMNECASAMSKDGKYFFFTRDTKDNPEDYDGIPNIYYVETRALKLETLF